MSQVGLVERIGGTLWKLCDGGGDEVAHSKEWPSQGLSGALIGDRQETHMLIKKTTKPIAVRYAPAVESLLRKVK